MCAGNNSPYPAGKGAWIDEHDGGEQEDAMETPDLSYWSELGASYQPEWFPLAGTTGKK